MKFKTLDDYYAWTCDWCDSENRTLWLRVANGEVRCGACHRTAILPVATGKLLPDMQGLMAGLC